MDKRIKDKTIKSLDALCSYVNSCNLEEEKLYTLFSNAFSDLGAYFGSEMINEDDIKSEDDKYINACIAVCNAFKHSKELNGDYSDLRLLECGSTLDCVLDAPFGDVVYFKNAEILKGLKYPNNYKYYSEIFEGDRLDFILNRIKKIVGSE